MNSAGIIGSNEVATDSDQPRPVTFDDYIREKEYELKRAEAEERQVERQHSMEKEAHANSLSARITSVLIAAIPLFVALITASFGGWQFVRAQHEASLALVQSAALNTAAAEYTAELDARRAFFLKRDDAYYETIAAAGRVNDAFYSTNANLADPDLQKAIADFHSAYHEKVKTVDVPGDTVEQATAMFNDFLIYLSKPQDEASYQNEIEVRWMQTHPNAKPLNFGNNYQLLDTLEQNMDTEMRNETTKEFPRSLQQITDDLRKIN